MTNMNTLRKKTIIFGAGGQLGSELMGLIPDSLGVYHATNENGLALEMSDYIRIEDLILKCRPEIIVNATALTNVDACETEKQKAISVNAEAVRHIARAASVTKSYLVHVSTDYVFDGRTGMYKENSEPNPINYYGLTKLLGDWAALSYDDSLVVRTSGVFGFKNNYPKFVLNQLNSGKEINAVKSFYSPIHARLLAEAIVELIQMRRTGVINVAGPRISRYDLAIELAKRMGVSTDGISELDQNEMTWVAKRPYDSSLDSSLSRKLLQGKYGDLDKNLKLLVNG